MTSLGHTQRSAQPARQAAHSATACPPRRRAVAGLTLGAWRPPRWRRRAQRGAGLDGGGNPVAHQGAGHAEEVAPTPAARWRPAAASGCWATRTSWRRRSTPSAHGQVHRGPTGAGYHRRDFRHRPTVFSNGQTGAINEFYYIRGFASAIGDVSFGGLYGISPYYRVSPEMFERIDVLKGPSALLNGMPPGGSVGGSVNLVPKRAGDDPLARLTAPICPTRSSAPTWTWAGVSATTSSSASASTACTATAKARSTTRSTSRSWARWSGLARRARPRLGRSTAKTASRARRAASAWRPASPCPSRPSPTRC